MGTELVNTAKSHPAMVAILSLYLLYLYLSYPDLFHRKPKLSKEAFRKKYGPWAVVIGGTGVMGAEWSKKCAEMGLNVIIIARKEDKLNKLAQFLEERFHIKTVVVQQDVGKSEEWKKLSKSLANDYDIGLMIYNAGFILFGRHSTHSLEVHQKIVDVNITGVLIALDAFLPKMREKKQGGIILMASVDGQVPEELHSTYTGSKAFNRNIAEALYAELAEENIDVLGVMPGVVTTPTIDRLVRPDRRPRFTETSTYTVIEQGMLAFGRTPIITIGSFPKKLYWFIQLILPPKVRAKVGMIDKWFYRSEEELKQYGIEYKDT
jgi:short-subunit dehydrogenase